MEIKFYDPSFHYFQQDYERLVKFDVPLVYSVDDFAKHMESTGKYFIQVPSIKTTDGLNHRFRFEKQGDYFIYKGLDL